MTKLFKKLRFWFNRLIHHKTFKMMGYKGDPDRDGFEQVVYEFGWRL